jgi:hypothetical protein
VRDEFAVKFCAENEEEKSRFSAPGLANQSFHASEGFREEVFAPHREGSKAQIVG